MAPEVLRDEPYNEKVKSPTVTSIKQCNYIIELGRETLENLSFSTY